MSTKNAVKNISLSIEAGTFTGIFNRLRGGKKEYNFSDISALRRLLSNERAKLLHTIKARQPSSIYQLAKFVARDFKSVRQDIYLLEKFGFLELESGRKGEREMLKPILAADTINISIAV